ncbi:GyrI-like domain-containing protein [Paenibacillus sp. VCA1]|uniref:AraC family transcriptional regulator n=1 Tax=Paenibacillus sp. VCA1 TaxID=3039148 RepID=UPI0028720274|nr:GyrI-like domain-containing protein [Paenibacillus sp. VCA1]MDR9854806.1 GyrI-like domain-containing protein [Paenibacillus sp. VCA1]
MKMNIETIPNYRIAYVRQMGPYGPANAKTMEKLKKWAAEKHLLTESAILFGIPQDNPDTTLPENCRYDACIVISTDELTDDSIDEGEFSGGEYAVCTVKHTPEDVQKAWADVFPALQQSGYRMDHKPVVERYTGKMVAEGFCELCIPVIKN